MNTHPTFLLGVQSWQRTILHFGHCHNMGLRKPPASFPHLEQKPRILRSQRPPLLTPNTGTPGSEASEPPAEAAADFQQLGTVF